MKRDCTTYVAEKNTDQLHGEQVICAPVFAYAISRFSHDTAQRFSPTSCFLDS